MKAFASILVFVVILVGSLAKDIPSSFTFNCTNKKDGNYPHPSKCTHYIACVAGTHAYEMSCAMGPDGKLLHYVQNSGPDPSKSHCDHPKVAGCELDCGCSNENIFETPRFTYDCSDKKDGNYPHPTKCTHFVACVAGDLAYEMSCAMGPGGKLLHYVQDSGPNPDKSYCDYPDVVGCKCGCA